MVKLKNCGIVELAEMAREVRIFGFGVVPGVLANHKYIRTPKHDVWEYLYKFVDNNPQKQGTTVSNGHLERQVISIEELCDDIGHNDAILILPAKYGEIIEQLDGIQELDGIDCYILEFVDCAFDCETDMSLYENERGHEEYIPPVIHYLWFGDKDIPQQYRDYMKSWKKYCPNYEIKLWNENNYDIEKHPYTKWAYDNKMWPFVSDYARLDILYHHGGIYLDTDVELVKGLDDLRCFHAYMGYESTEIVNTGLGFGAEEGNEIVLKCMEVYDNIAVQGEFKKIPCTLRQTEVLNEMGLKGNNSFQMIGGNKLAVLPTDFLCGKRLTLNFLQITDNTHSIHHFAGDWGGRPSEASLALREKYDEKLWDRIYSGTGRFRGEL